jgi:DNA-binding NarL/FixJ family response regulator
MLTGAFETVGVGLHALLVENDQACASTFSQALSKYAIVLDVAGSLSESRQFLCDSAEQIDVVLLDPVLPDGRGEDLLPEIEALPRQPGVIILTNRFDAVRPDATLYRAIWVPKSMQPPALANIMRRVAKGCAHETLDRFAKRFRLTHKETRVLDLVASGVGPKQIAADLNCSAQAVYALLARASNKTESLSYQEVVAKLFQFSCHGLGHPKSHSSHPKSHSSH